ncbi:hypothetical protein M0R45_019457 [Rubus argutus]|uniref:Uncharacterized protein n=1 Tax=Rubus argutus TaxID=59490 RepID=A0AAW1X7G2_RUBAR
MPMASPILKQTSTQSSFPPLPYKPHLQYPITTSPAHQSQTMAPSLLCNYTKPSPQSIEHYATAVDQSTKPPSLGVSFAVDSYKSLVHKIPTKLPSKAATSLMLSAEERR